MMKHLFLNRRGQNIIEYAILIAIVTASLITMHTYVRRAIQGRLKQIEDQVNEPTILANP